MTDPFKSIDDTIGQIKADHALALRTLQDQLTASQIETSMAKNQLATAVEARLEAEKRTAKLQSLFAVVEHLIAEAKKLDAPTVTTLAPNKLPETSHIA